MTGGAGGLVHGRLLVAGQSGSGDGSDQRGSQDAGDESAFVHVDFSG